MRLSSLLLAGLAGATLMTLPQAAPAEVLFDDGKVRVQELRYKPGDMGPNIVRPFRVIRVVQGGTIRRTYPDGRTEDIEYKTGQTAVQEKEGPFGIQNVGTTDVVFFVVALKP